MDKKMKILSFIIFFVVVIALGYIVYSKTSKSEEEMLSEKVLTEVKYIEEKIINMANRINNITTQNYKVTTKKVEGESSNKNEENKTGSENSQSNSSENSQSDSNENSQADSSGSSQSNSIGNSQSDSNEYEEYNMERINELSKDKETEINWDEIQKEIEQIYTVMPTITLDLYQTNINQEDILNFNGYLDDLANATKREDASGTLAQLCNMYYDISKFTDSVSQDELYKTMIKTKLNVLKAYSVVNTENWDEVNKNMQIAIDNFSTLLTNTNVNNEKQVNINKSYVILNEIKNASNKQDKDVFFIKYKNLLEEMSSM